MRLLAQLYYLLSKRLSYRRFNSPDKFDALYSIDKDPFNVRESRYEKHKFSLIRRLLCGRRFSSLLDIGCGPGAMTKRLAPLADKITAIDFSERAIHLAKEYCKDEPHIELIVADVSQYVSPFQRDCFFCSEVLYYLPDEGLDRALINIRQMAAQGAILIAVTRADDKIVYPRLAESFKRLRSAKSRGWLRPFRIDLFEVR